MTVPSTLIAPGVEMPWVGVGTARVPVPEARRIVAEALGVGYRLVDTAAKYENEVGVGQGIADSGVARADLFVTTKLRGADQGHAEARKALRASLDRLQLDHVDLYLVHWPLPRLGQFVDSYRAIVEMRDEGLTRAVGVSNFLPEHLQALTDAGLPTPAVNQVEFHPWLQQADVVAENTRRGVTTEAWSPLGAGNGVLDDPVVLAIARDRGVSPAQVLLRWDLERGLVTIPMASTRERLEQNLDLFSFELTAAEVAAIDALERGERSTGQHPATHEEF